MIFLFTDYGWQGPWRGQLQAVLMERAPHRPVVDLMHDAPAFRPGASAHLLAALGASLPSGSICVGVVDPGVGTARDGVVLEADGRWFVGPDNGLLDVIAARAQTVRWWRIDYPPEGEARTFHGRDLFAPVAAMLANGEPVPGTPLAAGTLVHPGHAAGADRAAVIYLDGFGNAATGIRAHAAAYGDLVVAGRRIPAVGTFADLPSGEPGWLCNSLGLVEVVANQASAAECLGLALDTEVAWAP